MTKEKEVDINVVNVTLMEKGFNRGKEEKGVIYFHLVGKIPSKALRMGFVINKIFRNHLVDVLRKANMTGVRPQDLTWSKTAGCSCGCSPGFVSRTKLPKTVYVDYKVVLT